MHRTDLLVLDPGGHFKHKKPYSPLASLREETFPVKVATLTLLPTDMPLKIGISKRVMFFI